MTKSTDQNHFHDQPLWAIDALSADRLSNYLVQENGDLTRAVLRYKENLSWSADLYQWLALAEVVLRNALISSLTPKNASIEGFDPFIHVWQDLRPEERADYEKAVQRVLNKRRETTPGRIIGELSFSFWRFLLASDYEHSLWVRNFRHAFVALEKKDRQVVYTSVQKVNTLRNRVAHHERLIDTRLIGEVEAVIDLIRWISPEALIWAEVHLPKIRPKAQ